MATAAAEQQQLGVDFLIAQAHEARQDFVDAAQDYRIHAKREMELADTRHVEKLAACLRLKGTTNALTDRPHTGTSAESIVEADERYAQHLATLRDVVFAKNAASARMESAKMRVTLAVAAIRAGLGVS